MARAPSHFSIELVPGKLAALLYQAVDRWIIERADHHVHGLRQQAVRERAELPIAQMSGGEQNAVAGLFGFEEMLQPFVTDPLGNVLAIDAWKSCEGVEQPGDGAEDIIHDGLAFRESFSRGTPIRGCAWLRGGDAARPDRGAWRRGALSRAANGPATTTQIWQ